MRHLMRHPGFAIVSTLLLATAANAESPAARTPTTLPAQSSLGRAGPELNFDQVALTDAIDFFRAATGANFNVDWSALQEVGLSRETPVSLRLRAVATGVALRKTLDAAGPGLLAFYVEDNVIQITTKLVADQRLVTRVYSVGDLLLDVPDFTDAPTLGLPSAGGGSRRGGGGGGGGSSGSLLGGGGGGGGNPSNQPRKTMAERADALIDLIHTTVRPEVWDVNGGKAVVKYTAGRLIVTAPLDVQKLIGG